MNRLFFPRCDDGQLPEEVFFAEDVVISHKALFFELFVAMCAFEALGVPAIVEDLEDEPIKYQKSTSRALWDGGGKGLVLREQRQ